MYDCRVLVELFLAFALEEDLVGVAVFFVEVDRGGNVEIVKKARNVEKNGVAVLHNAGQLILKQSATARTSVTPNSLTVVRPPFSTPSSASICWKTSFWVISLKSCGSGGRHHC